MKKFFFTAALAALALTACNKSGSIPETPSQKAQLGFSISTAAMGETRAAPVGADEVQVNTVDAFIFNATGDLDAYGHYTSDDFTTTGGITSLNNDKKLPCSTGSGKTVWIVINGDDSNVTGGYASGIKTRAELESQVFLLSQNARGSGTKTLDNFQMIGSRTEQKFLPGDNLISVEVSRPVARVWIKKITKNFASAAQAAALTVKNIYMSNVVGSCRYDGVTKVAANDLWYNKYTPGAGGPSVTIDNAMNLWLNRNLAAAGVSIAEDASATTEVESTFYVMPNNVPWGWNDDNNDSTADVFGPVGGSTWTPRHTNLVVETEYAGKTYYYCIPVAGNGAKGYPIGKDGDDGSTYEGLQANYSYEINELVLTRLGTTSPDEPVLPAMASVNITVKPWTAQIMANNSSNQYVI